MIRLRRCGALKELKDVFVLAARLLNVVQNHVAASVKCVFLAASFRAWGHEVYIDP